MSYQALYRTYRPTNFNEVAGQEHITTTLKNALRNSKVAHAYLFTGPRGTGKTSIARIFAKGINCEHAPIENPCNACPNCLGIQNGSISDIIEIDAASNNGVDEIRELRDKVKYLPGYVKYKVYIIDEVHMLSPGAFNALLKTLEEPPAHVVFILCTTEPQKLPLTIISRCQRFDFKAITVRDIIKKLKEIVEKEKILIDEAAIEQIAIYADGGMRDAVGMLDQAYAYDPDVITVDDINQICGAVSFQKQMEIVSALRRSDATAAIKAMDELIVGGKEVQKICQNLIQFLRDILVFKNVGMTENTSSLYQNPDFLELSSTMNNRRLFFYLDLLNKAQNDIKWSNSPRLYLELAFIKMTNDEPASESRLLEAIESFQKRLDLYEKKPEGIPLSPIPPQPKPSIEETTSIIEKAKNGAVSPTIEERVNQERVSPSVEPTIPSPGPVSPDSNPSPALSESACSDLSRTYPIEFVEEVLNRGNREDKNTLIDRWNLVRGANASPELATYANLIGSGTLVASSGNKIIITFPTASICNRLMTPAVKSLGKAILKNAFKRDIDFLALPTDVFQSVSDEFINAWKQGKRNIRLSPIVCPDLRDVSAVIEEKVEQSEPKVVSDAVNLFGDLVKVKK
ncbi:MAG TPA: DNA polymerase III subunit gamma/tau [Candidatus Izemoplasmatales bacterium]|nr:DNA polymerase III subunit gamma/tau [Candidatus Izemoplasmatales bacterium]